jgi:hypothetical protein
VETILKDFGEIESIDKVLFIEINNTDLKDSLLKEASIIRSNIKDLIREKFKSHIDGIGALYKDFKDAGVKNIDGITELKLLKDKEIMHNQLIKKKQE